MRKTSEIVKQVAEAEITTSVVVKPVGDVAKTAA